MTCDEETDERRLGNLTSILAFEGRFPSLPFFEPLFALSTRLRAIVFSIRPAFIGRDCHPVASSVPNSFDKVVANDDSNIARLFLLRRPLNVRNRTRPS